MVDFRDEKCKRRSPSAAAKPKNVPLSYFRKTMQSDLSIIKPILLDIFLGNYRMTWEIGSGEMISVISRLGVCQLDFI